MNDPLTASLTGNQSIIVPAVNAAAGPTVAVATSSALSTLKMQATLPSSSSVSPIGSSTPTKPLTPTNQPTCASNYLLPISSIQMFVYYFAPIMDGLKHSDFLTSNQRLEIGAALWEPLFNHQLPNIQCLTVQVKPRKNQFGASSAFFSNDATSATEKQTVRRTAVNNSAELHNQTSRAQATIESDRRRSSSIVPDQSQFGDVFLGGPPTVAAASANKQPVSTEPTAACKFRRTDLIEPSQTRKHGQAVHSTASQQLETEQSSMNASYATYLDIAILRCLFISDWQESGVYWSITFLSNRLAEIRYLYESENKSKSRQRSKSLSDINQHDLKLSETLRDSS